MTYQMHVTYLNQLSMLTKHYRAILSHGKTLLDNNDHIIEELSKIT